MSEEKIVKEGLDSMVPKLLNALITFCKQSGDMPLKDKIWHWEFDGEWEVIVNGKMEAVEHTTKAGCLIDVDPGHFKFEYNGLPAGDLDINGNGWFAAGECANMETCIAAIEKETNALHSTDDNASDNTGTDGGNQSQ